MGATSESCWRKRSQGGKVANVPRTSMPSRGAGRAPLRGGASHEAKGHASLKGHTPLTFAGGQMVARAELNNVRWVSHCRGLVQLPVAA